MWTVLHEIHAPRRQHTYDRTVSSHSTTTLKHRTRSTERDTSTIITRLETTSDMANDITFPEFLALSRLTFEWADSYDSKDFSRLAAILAPTVTLDYSEAFGQKPITVSRGDFLKLSTNENRLGGIVDCIHHIGGSKYDRTGPDSVTGYHQVRERVVGEDGVEVKCCGCY